VFPFKEAYLFFFGAIKLKTAVKITAPTIVHIILYSVPRIENGNGSGRFISRASHEPIKAPINPTTIESMQPPRSKPTKDLAIPPAIPAIIREMRMSIILNNYLLNKAQYKVILINIRINFKKLSF
jgi:hypothetical protein